MNIRNLIVAGIIMTVSSATLSAMKFYERIGFKVHRQTSLSLM